MRHLTVAVLGWAALSAHAAPTTLGFEDLDDGVALSSQYAGVEFHGGLSLRTFAAGGNLNEFDFPPHDGVAAAFSDAALQVDFTAAVSQIGGYFSYVGGLRLSAFDAGGGLLGVALSAFSNNTGTGGDSGSQVNEFIGLGALGDIRRLVIESTDPLGGAFVFDDLSFNTDPIVRGLPEPATWALGLLAGLTAAAPRRRRPA